MSDTVIEEVKVFGHVPKNSINRVRVRSVKVAGKPYLDVRNFFQHNLADDTDAGWRPTGRGLCLKPEQWREIQTLIEEGIKDMGKQDGKEKKEPDAA